MFPSRSYPLLLPTSQVPWQIGLHSKATQKITAKLGHLISLNGLQSKAGEESGARTGKSS